jgi:ATP-binding cassette subfamily B protein
MGSNGSGKTTLLDLLGGLLVPDAGRILIDGVELKADNRAAWMRTVAYLQQKVHVSDSTLAENIAWSVPASRIDQCRLIVAAEAAQLQQCIADLPAGYHERLGENGVRLSGGQRQRLGIARALYRAASVLMLDETTSALDIAAEQDITDLLAARRAGRTIILVAHRLSALRHCDVIHEVADGKITRSGTLQELQGPPPKVRRAIQAVTSAATP